MEFKDHIQLLHMSHMNIFCPRIQKKKLMIYKILRRYTGLIGLISSDPLSRKVIMIQEAVREVQGTIAHVFKRKSLSHSVDKNTKKIISQEFNILTHT